MVLGQVANAETRPFVHWQVCNVLPVELYGPAVGGNQTGDHVEHGRLAGAIGAKKTHGFTPLNRETCTSDNRPALVALRELIGDEAVFNRNVAPGRRWREHSAPSLRPSS